MKQARIYFSYFAATVFAVVGLIVIAKIMYPYFYEQHGVLSINIHTDEYPKLRRLMTEYAQTTNYYLGDSSDDHNKWNRMSEKPSIFMDFFHWKTLGFVSYSVVGKPNNVPPSLGIVFHTKSGFEDSMPEVQELIESHWPGSTKLTLRNESS